ncbi:MAG: enhanced serine sensitivity protein SseB C-terminal domain-containing protein [Oscillospiraceae bacterium]|nr:enhanced serine sensitivity protein SseB C-terminal domain-containing protein [Oscillospiraceae bacterium]
MASLQELIDLYFADPTETAAAAVNNALRGLDTVHAAFCQATGHYYMEQEHGMRSCFLFSDPDLLTRFAALHKELVLVDLPIQNRLQPAMLADLYRSGFERIVVNAPDTPYALELRDLIRVPDYSGLPLEQQPILSPEATGSVIYLAQKLHGGNADGVIELDVLRRLYHAPFLLAVQENGSAASLSLPDGSRCCLAFTDPQLFDRYNRDGHYHKRFVYFDALRALTDEEGCHILLNAGDGAQLPLDRTLLKAAEDHAQGLFGDVILHSMKGDSLPAGIDVPTPWPQALADALTAQLQTQKDVEAAYLFTIRREHSAAPHFLIALRWSGLPRPELYEQLYDAAAQYASGRDLEFTEDAALSGLLRTHEPFYVS